MPSNAEPVGARLAVMAAYFSSARATTAPKDFKKDIQKDR